MKITILITTYNRPDYLRQCLDSIKRSDLKGAEVWIIDDASTDIETHELIKKYCYSEVNYNYTRHLTNMGICETLLSGINFAFKEGSDIVINLDSDAIVRNDWIEVLLNLHKKFPDKIITGFHSITKNKDGSERHKMIRGGEGWCEKLSVGGINMLFTKETYEKYAKPALEKCITGGGNWDHQTCINAGSVICSIPSVVQHIGLKSSLGHMHDIPDVAVDFKELSLPNVTVVCVDDNKERCFHCLTPCIQHIAFGRKLMINPEPKLGSKEAYSKFIIKELHKYIDTDYVLIVQHDGYVKNWQAWTDEFLKYDYIGAPWWYKDGMNVGNGGFSLRSKKLLKTIAELPLTIFHPEDHMICRVHRKELEARGLTFAPEELASKFSFEGYSQTGHYTNQFGFHGHRAFHKPPDPKKTGFIINQFLGLGDILFLVPLVRKWLSEGHDVIWPVADEYFDLKDYFPDIQFVKKSEFQMNYSNRTDFMHRWQYGVYQVKSLRWNLSRSYQESMTTKYTMYGEDYNMWRELRWERNYEKEKELKEKMGAKGKYCLVCNEFGNITDGGQDYRKLVVPADGKYIFLRRVPGYSMLDWAGIIEDATEIHAVSSSTLYMFEVLNLKAKEINLYSRKMGKLDFQIVERLLTKRYIFHV